MLLCEVASRFATKHELKIENTPPVPQLRPAAAAGPVARPGRAQVPRRKKARVALFYRIRRLIIKRAGTQEKPDMKQKTFSAVIHKEDDLYVAECPELGTVSQGHSIEDALTNLKEATELYLEEFPLSEAGHPLLTTFEAAVNV